MPEEIHLLHFKRLPIFEQLRIEEALLRLDYRNWCVINEGSLPAIVMGISGRPEEWIDMKRVQAAPLPIIQRYSGGGAVVVDDSTLFVSFLFQKEVHDFPCYPEPIFRWSELFYKGALPIPAFHLLENDFAVGQYKCGGNAQYIKKNRFALHSTFLWDYNKECMDYLLYPPKTPFYRKMRSHSQFLCRLREYLNSKEHFVTCVKEGLSAKYNVKETTFETLSSTMKIPHRQSTRTLPSEPVD